MSELITRTARLVPYTRRPKHGASFVTAYIYEPAADEPGAELGNLFAVFEVLVSGRASEEVIDLVIQSAGDRYYNVQGPDTDALTRFEAAIKQTNHELSEYVGRGNAAWIGKLSAILAVQAGDQLHVAQTGSAEAFLYRGKAVSRISQSETTRPFTPSKTFGSIATGELDAGDKLLLATPALVHQIPLAKLHGVIASTGPNGSIQEISQLLEGADTNRIAAIVAEITTPELAALSVRSGEPAEIELGNNETFAEAAMSAAVPLAQSTATTSRKAAQAAKGGWDNKGKPLLRKAGLAGAEQIRRVLRTSKGRRITLAAFLMLAVLLVSYTWNTQAKQAEARNFAAYQQLFTQYSQARDHAGDKSASRQTLVAVQKSVGSLGPKEASINRSLKNQALIEGEPTSVSGFKTLLADTIDQIDGLVKVNPVTIAEIGGKSGRPTHFESDGTTAYVIDAAGPLVMSKVNLQTGALTKSTADFSKLNDVIATTLSAGNDGIFILTSKPSVWLYKFATDSLSEQTLAYGQWPKSHGIASYGSNLYLLGDAAVYKHVRNATGYSPKTDYITTTPATGQLTSIAVDGNIYLSTSSSLYLYIAAAQKQSLPTPSSLSDVTNTRSVAGGNFLIGTSQSSGRIALWSAKTDKLVFSKQIAVNDIKKITDATYDQKLGKVFATVDNRLVSFPLKP